MSENNYALAAHYYPCLQNPAVRQKAFSDDIVLLHGWGSGSQSWQPLIPALQTIANVIALDLPSFGESEPIPEFTLDAVLPLIAAQLPDKCILIGWSLGGMLAIQIAARYPQKISRIITLAANLTFVASHEYETAMPRAVNCQFNQSFASDPKTTLKLFSGLLAQGDSHERTLLKQIRALAEPDKINPNWQQALALLASLDNRESFAQLSPQGLHLFAENDSLVPVAAAGVLAPLNARQRVTIIAGAAHALHWSKPEFVVQAIVDFIQPDALNKKQVASSFSRAAPTYDSVASLQRNVGERLLNKIIPNSGVHVVLDLGCGTGYFASPLQSKYPQALTVGVDIAEGMLGFAREHHGLKNGLCADAEWLPFADQSVDIVFSNFALQWCANLPHLFAELQRILKPGGELVFTTLGPETLHELKSAWAQVDTLVHVNQFHEREQLLTHLNACDFEIVEFICEPEIMWFAQLPELTRSLKALGAQNMNRGRSAGLTGRKKMQAFKQAYETFRRDNLLPATYDVYYVKVKSQ